LFRFFRFFFTFFSLFPLFFVKVRATAHQMVDNKKNVIVRRNSATVLVCTMLNDIGDCGLHNSVLKLYRPIPRIYFCDKKKDDQH
jgi:hypothetical protein